MDARRFVADSVYSALRVPGFVAALWERMRADVRFATRYAWLRARGYPAANYAWKDYGRQSPQHLAAAMREVFERAKLPRFDVILEQGCGTRHRTTPGLRECANEIWGLDLMPESEILGDDRYFKMDLGRRDLLHEMPDKSVDAVVIINYIGMHPHSTWLDYFSPHNNRIAPYLEPENFPRVLRPGGYMIVLEWEAEPEARWGRATPEEIDRRSAEVYKPPQLPGWELVTSGFTRSSLGPFVVYRLQA